jgi:hypothetical protein
MSGDYGWLCRLYLDGNPKAIEIIDTLISAGSDLAYLRNNSTQVDYEALEMDYLDVRADLDLSFDKLDSIFRALDIKHSLPVLGGNK